MKLSQLDDDDDKLRELDTTIQVDGVFEVIGSLAICIIELNELE